MTRSRNCGLQKISGGSWRFPGGSFPPETCLAETLDPVLLLPSSLIETNLYHLCISKLVLYTVAMHINHS